MSASTQLQMAPQTTLVQVNQNPNQVITSTPSTPTTASSANQNNQDNSNMSTGSSHSDKEIDRDVIITQAIINNTPEKIQRQQSERKRKRKPTEDNGNGPGSRSSSNDILVHQNSKGPRISIPIAGAVGDKKINDYFHSKHSTNSSARHTGAKSPSPQHGGAFPMYPPSPQPPLVHSINVPTQDYFKARSTSNIVPVLSQPTLPPPSVPPTSNHQSASVNATNNLLPLSNIVVGVSQSLQNQLPAGYNLQQSSSSISSATTAASQQNNHNNHQQQQQQLSPHSQSSSILMVSKAVQTDLTSNEIQDREAEAESNKTKIDDMTRLSDEQKTQINTHQKMIDQQKSHINKCIDVVKKLLKQKSNIEKKEARQKCMQNRLRLGQFVTQRVGATFQENWTDGYAFQELARRQEEITSEREEIDRQKKSLVKKRPTNQESGRKRNSSTTTPTPSTSANVHNGGEVTFLKPEPVANSSTFTLQEYYECDEILKLRHNALKKEDADLQLEMEKLERERNLHIRELKRIHNEDQVRLEFFYSSLITNYPHLQSQF